MPLFCVSTLADLNMSTPSLFLYVLLGGLFAGVAYFVYTTYFDPSLSLSPSSSKSGKKASSASGSGRPSAVTAKSSSIVDNVTGEMRVGCRNITSVRGARRALEGTRARARRVERRVRVGGGRRGGGSERAPREWV